MIPTIQIKDNFLNEKEFKILYNNVDKVSYVPKVDIEGRNYGFRYEFGENSDNQWLLKKIKKQFFPNTNLKPNGCMHYHLRHNHEKVLAHTDPNDDYCFILYLKGEELVYNGTGFYQHYYKADELARLYNKTKDPKYKEEWYKLIKSLAWVHNKTL